MPSSESPTGQLRTIDRELVKELEFLSILTKDFTDLEGFENMQPLTAIKQLLRSRKNVVAQVKK